MKFGDFEGSVLKARLQAPGDTMKEPSELQSFLLYIRIFDNV